MSLLNTTQLLAIYSPTDQNESDVQSRQNGTSINHNGYWDILGLYIP